SKMEQEEMKVMITDVIHHPDLLPYYKEGLEVRNEQPILLPKGTRLIPDRLVIKKEGVVIMDYKTGAVMDKHRTQLNDYEALLISMDMEVLEKILVYTDSLEIVKWQG
ncbi:MAG: ATP-dependent helicase, partial [Nonlabens sp.]